MVSFWRLFAASDVLQDISSRGLVYYCDRRCPKGLSQLQFGKIMQPESEGAISTNIYHSSISDSNMPEWVD